MSSTAQRPASPRLGFQTLEAELPSEQLPVTGELPGWLSGSLLRTGPAMFEVGERQLRHWFDGMAMLHRFTISEGGVEYGNRYLESRAYRAARERGKIAYDEFATDPCRSLFKRVQTLFAGAPGDNGNVNIGRLGERFIAMTETPIPVEFDADTLRAAEVEPFRAPGELSTAHPHAERDGGALLNYSAKLGRSSRYRFFRVDPAGGSCEIVGSLGVSEPAYMHSFGLTERWLVLVEFPLVVNPLALALSGRPYIENFRWKPERGTRFHLIDRRTGETRSGFQADACFAFHHVNAYDSGGEVVVDLCAYSDASIVSDLYLERLREGKPISPAFLTRFRLRLEDGGVSSTRLAEVDVELPRINYARCNERPYRFVWGAAQGASGFFERIVKIDTRSGAAMHWGQEGCYAGEPVFVARPDAQEEDDGVLLSVVLDAAAGRSFLLVLDAIDLAELARASVPHHIPFGFHGQFARSRG